MFISFFSSLQFTFFLWFSFFSVSIYHMFQFRLLLDFSNADQNKRAYYISYFEWNGFIWQNTMALPLSLIYINIWKVTYCCPNLLTHTSSTHYLTSLNLTSFYFTSFYLTCSFISIFIYRFTYSFTYSLSCLFIHVS